MRRILLLTFTVVFVMFMQTLQAQDRTISGKVTSLEDGSALPGVNVVLKGTTLGAVTDIDGNYSVSVPANSKTLVFSFIGLSTEEIEIGERTTINVQMSPDVQQLSEVIISGVAGATPREKLTVSVAKIGEDRLNAVTGMSLATSLTGKVAGVRISNPSGAPGGASNILLRADNNLNNVDSDPLIIIDGQIMVGSLADINADDVASMEVIKGASASALYGSRAGNGVIAITTKRGSSLKKGDVRVTLRNEVGVQQIGKTLDLATHHPYALADDYQDFVGQYTKYDGVTYPDGYRDSGWHPGIAGNRTIDDDHYMDNEYGVVRDQQDMFFRIGVNYTNYVAVAANNTKSSIFASFENNSQEGIIMNTDGYDRQNFRVNYDLDVKPWLRLSTSNLFINTETNYPGSGGGVFFNIALAEPDANLEAENPDGQPYYLRMNQFNGETVNPLYPLYKAERDNKSRRWMGNYAANIEFADWINLDLSQSIEIYNYRYTLNNPADTWTPTGGTDETFGMSYTKGSLNKYSRERVTKNSQATLNLHGKVGDLTMKGKLSYLFEDRHDENFQASASQYAYKATPDFDNFSNISNASSGEFVEKAQNYFAILGLDWRDKLLFDGMFRYDGSSLFGPDSRWNSYYRLSGAYRITEDVEIPGINELKIRAAYGTAGMRPGFDFQYEIYRVSSGSFIQEQVGNYDLKPSVTTEREIGLNASIINKINFEASYAKSTTEDQFLRVPLFAPTNEGFAYQYQNAGTVESNTFEMSLGGNWVNKSDFTWNSNIVFSRVRQKITELPIAPYVFGDTDGGAQSIFYVREGETYGSMYGYTWVRSLEQMAQQLPEGSTIEDYEVNSDGYVVPAGSIGTPGEQAIKVLDEEGNPLYTKIGDGVADFNMGIANTLTYKGFTLYFLFDIKAGGDVYNSKGQWVTRDLRNGIMDMSGVPDSEKKAYDYYVNFYDVNTPNSYWVEDASFVKLRELSLGYSVPTTSLSGFLNGTFKAVRFKLVGRNLLTFSDYSGYDPEIGTVRQPYDGTYAYPNFRNYAASLTLEF
ncbi:SusC/RagA family TonB-linked outer membrane protein [Fulvivirga ligni]|uniref:SusC/RagA family TonB-linked outer membrane protein n=1 Tax=Fulvivirga ligni TaxID=2904246 RepID=UPI001F3F1918|nr:SusC/RagA family TonB-linked outer membrane protein [Fulvivirga ligni]UII23500.1 SusC/RagA family TonB-linked outer membrane protein [Fulvivirga ligni]